MRSWSLTLLLTVSACSAGPAALGITGPNPSGATPAGSYGAVQLPRTFSSDNAAVLAPGTPTVAGSTYAPSVAPTYGDNGRYYGD